MKRLGIVAAWVAATFLTAMVAWSAVNLAGDQVTDRPVLPLSSAEVEALPEAPAAAGPDSPAATAPATTTSTTTTVASPPAPTTTEAATTTSAAASTTTAPPASTTTTTTASTTTTAPTTTSTTEAVAPPEVSAYSLVGGVVTIEAAAGEVRLISASPNAGFSVEVKAGGPDRVEVEFESATHESSFRARWDGTLVVEKDEEPEDGDD